MVPTLQMPLSVLNPGFSNKCPFCGLRETVFHVFTECSRVAGFLSLLTLVFSLFVFFSENVFIFGAGRSEERRVGKECRL